MECVTVLELAIVIHIQIESRTHSVAVPAVIGCVERHFAPMDARVDQTAGSGKHHDFLAILLSYGPHIYLV